MKRSFLYILVLLTGSLYGVSDIPWQKTKENEGILTYQKSDGSNILQVKGVVIIDARIDVTGGIFRDIPMHHKWVGYCEEAKILKIVNPKHYIFYEILAPPWPVTKRDLIIDSISTYFNDKMKVSINSMATPEQYIPETTGYVRMKELQAKIDFEFISENKTGISYELKVNPAGNIPPFIINIFNQIYIFQNMKNLKKLTNDTEYIKTLSHTEDTKLFQKLLNNPVVIKNTLEDRLARYIKSNDNIKLLANDPFILNQWKENKNGFAEILFLGIHDNKYQRKVLEQIIKIYLERYAMAEKEIKKMVNDPQMLQIFVDGKIESKLTEEFIGNHKSL